MKNLLIELELKYKYNKKITEVKQHRVVLVLGWVTAWEYTML